MTTGYARIGTVLMMGLCLFLGGCSRIEQVKIISHFAVEVRLRLFGEDAEPTIPPSGQVVLKDRYYIGSRTVPVTVLRTNGKVITEEQIDVPGDSMTREFAVIEIGN